ncbi:MAG: ribonuclease P protein subunit [Candidatus Aenigmatarchaeota archaeon]
MPITPSNIVRHELIGLETEIKSATNKYLIGLKGLVVDETYGMLMIQTKKGEKR